MSGDVETDEIGDRINVLAKSVKLASVLPLLSAAVSGADWIDENQIGVAEYRVFVLDQFVWRRWSLDAIGPHVHALGSKCPEVQPDRRRTGSAIETEHDRPLRQVADAITGVGDVENGSACLVFLILELDGASGRGVVDLLSADRHRASCLRGLLSAGLLFFFLVLIFAAAVIVVGM